VHIPRTGKDVYLYTPATQINVHNASNDRNSKSATSSTVYRYEAIAADEAFQTIVLAENETLQSELEKLLGDDLTLGGSHTGGYGQVSITKIQKMDNWVEVSPSENNQDRVVITLLSDTIVRRQDGQVAGDFDAALRNALALVATSNHLEAFARVRIVGGFNRKAGLPLAQDWALQAGSVFVYRPKDLDLERVRELQSCGIGERRVEGYGRFAINWQWVSKPIGRQTDALLNHLTNLPPVKPSALPTESPWTNSVHQVQQTMATRQLRARLNTEIIRLVSRADLSENLPTNAQLSRVRLAVRDGMTTGNLVMLKNLLENLKAAKQQFAQSRISNESLLEWLKRMCRIDLDRFKSEFGLNEDLPAVGDQVAVLDQAMQVEYISRWIDGVMQKATKQNQAKGVYQ
jgi:CRISPR-associated protein Csx10